LFLHVKHIFRNGFYACALGISRGHFHRSTFQDASSRYEQKLAWASAKFAFISDVALGLMGSGLKKRESISGRFGDILSQMYMMSATLKRFKEDGSIKDDEVLLRVAMEDGFYKIDEAFIGIYENLATGFLGFVFKLAGFCSRLNPFSSGVKDVDLHIIARQMSNMKSFRDRVCSNIYHGVRVTELFHAAEAMQNAKEALAKEKKYTNSALNEDEKARIRHAKKLQEGIIAVDSFTNEEYFK
jgi:acyl-CoA dehydrogenase